MANHLEILNDIVNEGIHRELVQNYTEDEALQSTRVTIKNQEFINFGSCSYLGLENHPALIQGTIEAVQKFGTQFSTSRTYLSVGSYRELEKELFNIFQKPLIVSASTTLGHLATLPVVIQPGDAVLFDMQVHSSVQMGIQLLKAQGISCSVIPHNSMSALEARIKRLANKHNKIWYLADGVYSMYGDTAPLTELETLLNKYKQFHLYIDDAHGMGWIGKNGCGYVRSQIEHHPKMILVTSLNKSFASAGGVILFPHAELCQLVKNCGSTLTFSGPIQPPMIGAAIASAKLHQTEEITNLQMDLGQKIAFVNRRLREIGIPQFEETPTPLFFIPVGVPGTIVNIQQRMKKKGIYLNSASFPAVSIKKGGLRFMITARQSQAEIETLLQVLEEEYFAGLQEKGLSLEDVCRTFQLPLPETSHKKGHAQKELKAEWYSSITELSSLEWEECIGNHGSSTVKNLQNLEDLFSGNEKPEENATLHYLRISDSKNQTQCLALFCTALKKADMLEDQELSFKIEEKRQDDPYYLTVKQWMSGTLFSMGRNLWISPSYENSSNLLDLICREVTERAQQNQCEHVLLRDFDETFKKQVQSEMLNNGFFSISLPQSNTLENLLGESPEEFLHRFKARYRYSFRKEVLNQEKHFQTFSHKPIHPKERLECLRLFEAVAQKSLKINVFPLPQKLLEHLFSSPEWDVLRLYEKKSGELAAVLFSHFENQVYSAHIVGINYQISPEKNAYKQVLYQAILRAKDLGANKVDFAYTAEMEKKKVGALQKENFGFMQLTNHDAVIEMETYR